MAKDIIIVVLVAIIISAFIVLSGCANLPPEGPQMETGEVVKPPQGYLDWKNRIEPTD